MLKKISVALAASALTLTLAAPVAFACDGHKTKTVEKENKEGVVAKKDQAKKADESKTEKKTEKKKPVKVSKN